MRRLGWLFLLLLALVAPLAACGGPDAAATVGGKVISVAELDRDLADVAKNERFVQARVDEGVAFHGSKPGTYDTAIVAELLSRKITAVLVHQELDRRRLTVTPEDRSAAEGRLRTQVIDKNRESLLDGFPRRYVDAQVEVQAESNVLQRDEERVTGASDSYPRLLKRLRATTKVTVDNRYGVWDKRNPEDVRLVPPGAPAARRVLP